MYVSEDFEQECFLASAESEMAHFLVAGKQAGARRELQECHERYGIKVFDLELQLVDVETVGEMASSLGYRYSVVDNVIRFEAMEV